MYVARFKEGKVRIKDDEYQNILARFNPKNFHSVGGTRNNIPCLLCKRHSTMFEVLCSRPCIGAGGPCPFKPLAGIYYGCTTALNRFLRVPVKRYLEVNAGSVIYRQGGQNAARKIHKEIKRKFRHETK